MQSNDDVDSCLNMLKVQHGHRKVANCNTANCGATGSCKLYESENACRILQGWCRAISVAPVFIRIVPTVLYARKICNMAWPFCLFNDAARLWLHGGVRLATCNENGVSVQLIRPGSNNVLDPRRRIVIESDWSPVVASRSLSVVYVPDDDIHDAPFFLTRDRISRISDSDEEAFLSIGKMTSTSGTG